MARPRSPAQRLRPVGFDTAEGDGAKAERRGATAAAELRSVLRSAGLKVTASRLAVLAELRGARKPQSHAEVVEAMGDQAWDRATIYRNLVDLVGAGLARKLELGDRVWRFDAALDQHAHDAALHPHFVCTACGSVECLAEVTISAPQRGIPRALEARAVEVHVRGICDSCQ